MIWGGVFMALLLTVSMFNSAAQTPASQIAYSDFRDKVAEGSVEKLPDGLTTRFVITDLSAEVPVLYRDLLPDLFREGQGVVAEGTLNPEGVFMARQVLAKHDENYMPPEVAEALKKSGQWQGDSELGAAEKE